MKIIFLVFLSIFLLSCGGVESIKKEEAQTSPPSQEVLVTPPQVIPEPEPIREEISPLREIILENLLARNESLSNILYLISQRAGLNLIIEDGVDPDTMITITLKDVTVEDALNAVMESTDYFYSVKNNILKITPVKTMMFEIPLPPVSQSLNIDLGGDILGGQVTQATGAPYGTGNIKGNITQKIESERTAYNFWPSLEESLKKILDASTSKIKPSFSINRITGTVFVTAGRRDIARVEGFIKRLNDTLKRQVIIEARIAEVQLDEGIKYGIDWTFLDQWRGVGDITLGTTGFKDVVSTPKFSIGVTGANLNSILNALETQGKVNVLSNPKVNIMNGQIALLSVGRNFSFISRVETSTTTTGTAPTTTFTVTTSSLLSGIMLGVIPYIEANGEISMTITPVISDLVSMVDKTIGEVGQNIIQISLPTVDLREMSTIVKVKDGETIIIGGLIQEKDTIKENRVPFLGRIPLLGYLFKSMEKVKERKELVIMLRPVIVSEKPGDNNEKTSR